MADIAFDLTLVQRPYPGAPYGTQQALNNQVNTGTDGASYNKLELSLPAQFVTAQLQYVAVLSLNATSRHAIMVPPERSSLYIIRDGKRLYSRIFSEPVAPRNASNWHLSWPDLSLGGLQVIPSDVINLELPPASSSNDGDYIIDMILFVNEPLTF